MNMQDFNFFEPYLNKGKQRSATASRYMMYAALFVGLLAAWPLVNFGYGLWLQRETAILSAEVTGSEKYPLLAKAKQTEADIAKMQSELAGVNATDQALKASEWLTEPLLYSIVSAVPKDVKIDSLSVQQDKKVSLTGTAAGKPAIAELSLNIRATERFDGIFISSISNKDGSYSFDMSFSVKEGEAK
jgi:Tfp pilus assembly protein PilN